MTSLLECLQAYRASQALHARMRFAEEIIFLIGPALREFIFRHTRHDMAEDAYQETLVALATNLERCRARTEAQFRQWCYRIAGYKIADQWRERDEAVTTSLEAELLQRAVDLSAKDERMAAEEREELEYALALLRAVKPPCVTYLWERIALDLPYKDLARLHGVSEDTMRMRVDRCLKLARELVARKAQVTHG